jgi:hypothetical protein
VFELQGWQPLVEWSPLEKRVSEIAWSSDSSQLAIRCDQTRESRWATPLYLATVPEPELRAFGSDLHVPTFGEESILLLGHRIVLHTMHRTDAWDVTTLEPVQPPSHAFEGAQIVERAGDGSVVVTGDRLCLYTRDPVTWEMRTTLWRDPRWLGNLLILVSVGAWSIAFFAMRARSARAICESCGRSYSRSGDDDFDDECDDCRRRDMTADEVRREFKAASRLWFSVSIVALLFIAYASVASLYVGAVPPPDQRVGYFWPVFLLCAALAEGLFVYLLLRLFALVSPGVAWRCRHPARDLQLASRCAGDAGVVTGRGGFTAWRASASTLIDSLDGELELCRRRLADSTGISPPTRVHCRVRCFLDRVAFDSYLLAHRIPASAALAWDCIYLRSPCRKIVVCDSGLREGSPDPVIPLRRAILLAIIESAFGRRLRPWLVHGLAAALGHDDRFLELARLRRRLGPVLAARTRPMIREFSVDPKGLLRKQFRGDEHAAFARLSLRDDWCWSMVEFLGGRHATPERQGQFRDYCLKATRWRGNQSDFRRQFGVAQSDALAAWRANLEAQDPGPAAFPPAHLANGLNAIAHRASDADLPYRERIAAIRRLAHLGTSPAPAR